MEYNKEIVRKAVALVNAFREKLDDEDNYYTSRYLYENDGDLSHAADDLVNGKDFADFVFDDLYTETIELVRAILDAEVFGRFYAGFNPAAVFNTREEYAKDEVERTKAFYAKLNHTLQHFDEEMDEVIEKSFMGKTLFKETK